MSVDLAVQLHRLPRSRILVVGDLIVDVDLHGACERFAQEAAACPVFRTQREERREGGVGAVRAMVQGLGAECVLACGPAVSRRCRHFAEGRLVFRTDHEADPMTPEEECRQVEFLEDAAASMDCVLVADYGKGACTEAVLRAAINGAAARDVPCILDPARGASWRRYAGATCIKCNAAEWEAAIASGLPLEEVGSRFIVTNANEGMTFHERPARTQRFQARSRTAVDVTGAGDSVLATLGVCLAGGMDWLDACRVANTAAGLKVERLGAVPSSRAAVVADLLQGVKVLPSELLTSVVESHKSQGRRVAFTNGCFDVLHAGHIQCLEEARDQADVLIVGVNSDSTVRALKGPGRPVNPVELRTLVLAGLQAVDYVTVFDERTPLNLIQMLRPDVLVKGADYRRQDVVGAEFLESYGGRVHLAALRDGLSTTRLLQQLRSK